MVDTRDLKSLAGNSIPVRVRSPAPWRVFLQHLKGCKNTRFLYSEFTGGVVDNYAFSCIYGHFRDRQGQYRWNLNRSDAVKSCLLLCGFQFAQLIVPYQGFFASVMYPQASLFVNKRQGMGAVPKTFIVLGTAATSDAVS